jgi:ABC-2 type transport system permease protein
MATVQQTFKLSQPSLPANLRALLAIVRRNWLIFRRYPSWVFAMLLWPIIFPAFYILGALALAGPDGSGLVIFEKVAGTTNYLGYIVVGTTIWMWQNIVLWDVGFALREEQMRGTLETNWLTPTFRFSFLLGSSINHLLIAMIFLIISFIEYALFYGIPFRGNPLVVLLVLLAAIPSIYGLGFAFASLVITAREAQNFVMLVRGLVMIFCGTTYPIYIMPTWMQGIAKLLPQTYIIHAFRNAILEKANLATLLPDLSILSLFGIFWLVTGGLLFTWMERRARKSGAIGQY